VAAVSARLGVARDELLADLDLLGGPGEEHLAPLRTAVAANRVVRLTYRSETRAATTVREVEPWSLTAAGGGWYLQGWCRTAGGPRDFRLDRIRELAVTGETADPPPAPPPPPTYRPEPHHERVVLECTPAAAWLAEWAMAESDVPARGRRRRITLAVDHLDWAARLVLRMGDDVRVVSPDALAARVRALAAEALDRYGDAADGSPRGA
jgi:proteasome accessory factor C